MVVRISAACLFGFRLPRRWMCTRLGFSLSLDWQGEGERKGTN
jgi:hypothetical protein